MIGIVYCGLGFILSFALARKSLGAALAVVFTSGYFYGLIRGRYLDGITHFGADSALLGLYLGYFFRTPSTDPNVRLEREARTAPARTWSVVLIGWGALVMFYSPLIADSQPIVIQLLGFRPLVVFIPLLIVASELRKDDLDILAPTFAVLNLIALAFALGEYVLGVEAFLPHNAQTDLIYRSTMEAQGEMYARIPSIFAHAHAYAGAMNLSIPIIAHGLESDRRVKLLCVGGLLAAVIGVFIAAARLPAVMLIVSFVYVLGTMRVKASTWAAFAVICAIGAYLVVNEARMQRITTLNENTVEARVAVSVNSGFFDLLFEYPFGAGLSRAFGTNIPYFLQGQALPPIGIENEFGRIVVDTGIPGLLSWIAFFVWAVVRRDESDAAPVVKAFSRAMLAMAFLTAPIGAGLLAGIPGTTMMYMLIGLRTAPVPKKEVRRGLRLIGRSAIPIS